MGGGGKVMPSAVYMRNVSGGNVGCGKVDGGDVDGDNVDRGNMCGFI